jgi:ADP-ribosylglycohydrolase
MRKNARAMVLASLAADSLALAAHWIYDTKKIDSELGIVDHLMAPAAESYHPTKLKGDFTHYGDQAVVLLQHLAANKGFNLNLFAESWHIFSTSYKGYIDQATRKTLAALDEGKPPEMCGSDSSDLGGPARIAPLVYWYQDDPAQLMKYARQQTALTHNGAGVAAATDFIAQTALLVLEGNSPTQAINRVLEVGIKDIDLDLRVRRSLDTTAENSRKVIAEFGQMCGTSSALPGAVHLILAYEENLREALIQNVMAGGDSAARGLVVGMILGAYQGMDGIDENWIEEMRERQTIEHCLNQSPSR